MSQIRASIEGLAVRREDQAEDASGGGPSEHGAPAGPVFGPGTCSGGGRCHVRAKGGGEVGDGAARAVPQNAHDCLPVAAAALQAGRGGIVGEQARAAEAEGEHEVAQDRDVEDRREAGSGP